MKYLDGYPELDLLSHALSFSSPSLRVSTRIEAYSCKAIKAERRLFKTLEHDLVTDLTLSTSISPPEHHPALLDSAFGRLDKKESRKTFWLLIATLNLAFPDHDFAKVSAEEFLKEDSARTVLSSLSSALSHLRASGSDPSSGYYRTVLSYPPTLATSLPAFPGPGSNAGKSKQQKQSSHKLSASNSSAKAGKNGRASPFSTPLSMEALGNRLTTDSGDGYEIPTHPFLRQVLDPIIDLGECEVYSYNPDIDSDPHAYASDEDDFAGDEEWTSGDSGDEEWSGNRNEIGRDYKMALDDDRSSVDTDPTWNMDGIANTSVDQQRGRGNRRMPKRGPGYRKRQSRSTRKSHSNSFDLDLDEDADSTRSSSLPFELDGVDSSAPFGEAVGESGGDSESDETGGLLWSSNYFFYNRKMRRILFISCWGRKLGNAVFFGPSFIANKATTSLELDIDRDKKVSSDGRDKASSLLAALGGHHYRAGSENGNVAASAPTALLHEPFSMNTLDGGSKAQSSIFAQTIVDAPVLSPSVRITSLALLSSAAAPASTGNNNSLNQTSVGASNAIRTNVNTRKHYITPPATPSLQSSGNRFRPSPAGSAASIGSSAQAHNHGSAHRRTKRRASSHGLPSSVGVADRRRRTGIVTPARKIA